MRKLLTTLKAIVETNKAWDKSLHGAALETDGWCWDSVDAVMHDTVANDMRTRLGACFGRYGQRGFPEAAEQGQPPHE